MIKEPKNVDFYTTGRQPSKEEFVKISEWIKKKKAASKKRVKSPRKKASAW